MYKTLVVIAAIFWATGCRQPQYERTRTVYIVIKTPQLRYADMGFVETGEEAMRLQLYANGAAQTALEITPKQICSGRFSCMSKEVFTARFLSADYPSDTLEKILRGLPVMQGEGMRKTKRGFTQRIVRKGKYAVDYRVLDNRILFRDTINKILIKVVEQ